jgi:hypothetical protein
MLRYYRGNYLVSATTRALEDAVAAWCPETLTERNGKGAAGTRGGGGGGGGAASSASAANIRNNGRASSVTHAAYQPPPSGSATSTCAQRRYAHWLLMTSRGAFGPAARAGRGKAMTLRCAGVSACFSLTAVRFLQHLIAPPFIS